MLHSKDTGDWLNQKQDSSIWCLQEVRFKLKDTYKLKVKEIFHANAVGKKAS